MKTSIRWVVQLLLLGVAGVANAGDILDGVKTRGILRCGVSEGVAGFSEPDKNGRWQGIDADFCRAVAAAVLSDPDKIEFVPLKSSTRFPALQSRRIDLLVRATTWTLSREVGFNVRFPAVLFYDGQGFMVPKASRITQLAGLKDATVCVEKGTTHVDNLKDYSGARNLGIKPLVVDSAREVSAAFFAGRCQAYTSDASQLAAARAGVPDGAKTYTILPERISKEPLGPVVLAGDDQWTTVVRWVLHSLVLAEEIGITRATVGSPQTAALGRQWGVLSGTENYLGTKNSLSKVLGLREGWSIRAVAAVGNYGEMYERNVGRESALGIERGLNRLWTEGGLMYSPPID